MKLESLKLDKFKGNALKKEQMFMLNGGGVATGSGNTSDVSSGNCYNYDYGYDSVRNDGNGGTYITYHNRSNVTFC